MTEKLAIDQLTAQLVEQMIHLTKIIPGWLGTEPDFDLFTPDLHQFKAINAQLAMLLCTQPLTRWAVTDWRYNFITFLKQTLRQCHHCLKKCIVLMEHSPACSENLACFWQDVSPLISQAKFWLSATGCQLSAYKNNVFR